MSDLIIAAFGSQTAAFVAAESLAALQSAAGTEPEDIVVVTPGGGRIAVNQSVDLLTGKPLGGGNWGALIGLLFLDRRGPDQTDRGLAAQLRATGLDAGFLRDVVQALDQGGAVVGLRVRRLGADRVREHLAQSAGNPRILHTRLDDRTEAALCDLQAQLPAAARGQGLPGGAN